MPSRYSSPATPLKICCLEGYCFLFWHSSTVCTSHPFSRSQTHVSATSGSGSEGRADAVRRCLHAGARRGYLMAPLSGVASAPAGSSVAAVALLPCLPAHVATEGRHAAFRRERDLRSRLAGGGS